MDQFDAVAYFVRPGDNPELRVSLRSIHTYFPGKPVYIVGDKPDWVRNVQFLKGNPHDDKPQNVWANLVLLTNWDETPERLLLMMDDVYLTERVHHIPHQYRCTLEEHIQTLKHRADWWTGSLRHTATLLPEDALSYELHTPFPCLKTQMAQTLSINPGPYPPQWRTLYGNQWVTGAKQAAEDVKIPARHRGHIPRPYASTTDTSFRWVRRQLLGMFPLPSPFEAP